MILPPVVTTLGPNAYSMPLSLKTTLDSAGAVPFG